MTVYQRQLIVMAFAFGIFGTLSFVVDRPWWQMSLVALVPVALGLWWASAGEKPAQRQ